MGIQEGRAREERRVGAAGEEGREVPSVVLAEVEALISAEADI